MGCGRVGARLAQMLDASGHEVSRASGAPSKDAVLATLASAVAPASE